MLDLKGIRERLGRATPGEWLVEETDNHGGKPTYDVYAEEFDGRTFVAECAEVGHDRADADFIAHSKSDITSLLSEIDSLRETLRVAEKAFGEARLGLVNAHEYIVFHNGKIPLSESLSGTEKRVNEALSQIKTQLEGEG